MAENIHDLLEEWKLEDAADLAGTWAKAQEDARDFLEDMFDGD